jgi:hypothetical protein
VTDAARIEQALSACIRRCAEARDGRGRWRAVDRCAIELSAARQRAPHQDLLAWRCAEAAGRIGAAIAEFSLPLQRS